MAQTPAWRRRPLVGLVLLLVLIATAYLAGGGPGASPAALTATSSAPSSTVPSTATSTATTSTATTSTATTSTNATSTSATRGTDPASGLEVVPVAELPREVRDTLDLVARDGPYPNEQDGAEFFNREGLLPGQDDGWYREFTVETPGEDDRGARRIVTGADGSVYYTADHYESFVVVAVS